MMRRQGLLRLFLFAAALLALPRVGAALEEVSLLTSDGTLHVLRTGAALDLGVTDAGISPSQTLVEWSSRAQDGTVSMAILPKTISYSAKHDLDLAYDEQTSTLLVLWTEDVAPFSEIRVAVLRAGAWTNSLLLPSAGISRAYNPQMLVTHQVETYLDDKGLPANRTSSILSIVWWEQAQASQARYATLFLDETNFDPTALAIYDMPALVGGTAGDTPTVNVPTGAFLYPSLQADGLSGAVLVGFSDLHDQTYKIARIQFPQDWGQPSDATSVNWKRRHIPIVGIATEGPLPLMTPNASDTSGGILTIIGSGYLPTLVWGDATSLHYSRLDSTDWAPVRSIGIDDQMTYDAALGLIKGMGQRN
jgi:hypothetical protein